MRMTFRLLLLLPLWMEIVHNELRTLDKNITGEHERVLIRTKRRWVLSTIELDEEDPGPFPKEATQLFNDKETDYKLRFSISGQGVTTDPKGVFTINDQTGVVYVHKPIDREVYPMFQVEFDVWDRVTGLILDRTLSFNVAIKDINDNPPQFLPEILNTRIPENFPEGTLPVSLQAKDRDEKNTNNSSIAMRVVSQEPPSPVITLKPLISGPSDENVVTQLVFTGCFDYSKAKAYKMLVEARDLGTPALSSTATVNIAITDSNTHPPVFTSSKYDAQVLEMETNKEILRLSVEDKDTPNTPASKAVYKILKGNEEGYYKIETDPKTNEGVLTVIKGKDYERTTLTELEISVENEEPLFLCINGKPASPSALAASKPNTTKVAVKVIDVNDPPVFQKRIQTVYKKEEGNPGEVLYEPDVKDVDSDLDKIRYEIAEDPAKWVKVDPKTGKVTTVQKMDRESPYVVNGTYTVLIRAIDNGEPPATGTGTLVVQLGDLNDNTPYLTSNNSVLCVNKTDHVKVMASDADASPFAGPFSFSIGSDDKELLSAWKFNPSTGFESSLISLKPLPYGNYSIPIQIGDQQGAAGQSVLNVEVCDCGDKAVCRRLLPRSSYLHGAALGILLGALLLLALLLCGSFLCNCKEKQFKLNLQDEGNQTLINYNEEGGGSLAKTETQTVKSQYIGQKQATIQLTEFSSGYRGINGSMKKGTGAGFGGYPQMADNSGTLMTQGAGFGGYPQMADNSGTLMTQSWVTNRSNTYKSGTSRYSTSFSVMSDWNIEDHLHRKLQELPENQLEFPKCHPREYCYEGTGSKCPSLDTLSFSTHGNNLDFLNNLGPKFQKLDGICRQAMEEKNVKL